MATYLLTFATRDRLDRGGRGLRRYRAEAERLCHQAAGMGIQPILTTDEAVINCIWGRRNLELLSKPQFGYSAWKPYIILNVLTQLAPGDLLMYSDSNHIFLKDPTPWLEEAARVGVWLHDHAPFSYYPERDWVTMECFRRMECDSELFWNHHQLHANFHIWQAGNMKALQFLSEWQAYCEDERIVGWAPGDAAAGYPGFREHRNEQAVLSLLAAKWQLSVYPEPYMDLYDEHELLG